MLNALQGALVVVLLSFCTKSFMLRYPSRAPISSLCPSTPIDMSMRTPKPPTL